MSDRCFHELPVGQCADCRPAPAVDAFEEPAAQVGPWFHAAWGGYCEECGDRYEAGDLIRANGAGGYQCEHCEDDS